jgi:hypothetical protein
VRDPAFAQQADRFEDGHDTGLVVAAEYRGAVGADDVAVDDGSDVFPRHHRVHVRAQQERRHIGSGAREARQHVAGVGAHARTGVVDLDGGAHAGEDLLQTPGDGALSLGDAGNPHELQELVAQPRDVHGQPVSQGIA